ncbi:MAG TPA: hypothetical protein VG675_01035 [Bryobacteraceae bacterium]|nr:hypothetical protein [Bryobacteraceae bacterium]
MAGYLDQYGAGDERREKITKTVIVSIIGAAILAGVLYLVFHNHSEERQVERFFQLLSAHDYEGAYALWGCTPNRPCTGYPMDEFMKDWNDPSAPVTNVVIRDVQSCGSGVIVDVDTGKAGVKKLWVERQTLNVGFSPFPECPHHNRIADILRSWKYRMHGWTEQ